MLMVILHAWDWVFPRLFEGIDLAAKRHRAADSVRAILLQQENNIYGRLATATLTQDSLGTQQ